MIRGGGGRIVYISSMIGVQANAGVAAYGASKAGVNILSNVVHRELADQGVRTAVLAPGLTDTPGMRAFRREDTSTGWRQHIPVAASVSPRTFSR